MKSCETMEEFRSLSPDEQADDIVRSAAELTARHPEMTPVVLSSIANVQPTRHLLEMAENVRSVVKEADPS